MLKIILIIIIEVSGIKIRLRSFSIRISPGSRPNQFSSHGAKCSMAPVKNIMAPVSIIHLDMMQTDLSGYAGIFARIINYPHLLSPQFRQVMQPSISTSALV